MRWFSFALLACAACVGSDANLVGGGGGDAGGTQDGGGPLGDGAIPSVEGGAPAAEGGVSPGDVVVLDTAGIVVDGNGSIKEWKSGVGGLTAKPTSTTPPGVAPFPKTSEKCVVFGGERPLAIAPSPLIDLGFEDFSVTVVAIRGPSHSEAPEPKPDDGRVIVARNTLGPGYPYRGFALMSDWQSLERITREPRWAARLSYAPPSGLEVKGELRSTDGVREIIAMYRRGDELFLRDGATARPPTAGASAYDVSSALHPLTIGQSDDEDDPATRFSGRICAIVIHRGPETDDAIIARMSAFEARYPKAL
jgi:hypothetical protein